jgi:hypothetical protein
MTNYDEQFSAKSNELNELKLSFEQELKNGSKFSTLKRIFREIKMLEIKIKYNEIVDTRRSEKPLANWQTHGYYNKRFANGDDDKKLL